MLHTHLKAARPRNAAMTHERYVAAVAALAIARLSPEEAELASKIKLAYGSGPNGTRGVTYFGSWKGQGEDGARPFVEVCAFGEQDWIQLAGTTIHELGHVLAGPGAGHSKAWHAACARLGLRCVLAAGHAYMLANFAPGLREAIEALPKPVDGLPANLASGIGKFMKFRPCGAGHGTRGGKSRGAGSGSRLRLWACECVPPVKVRVASDAFAAHCDHCGAAFGAR